MKFIHAADIHLDSPLRGLVRYEGAPVKQIQSATRRAFINLIKLACDEAVDFVLLAGDLYDVDWKDYNTGLFFNHQMSCLRDANIPVFMVRGNHDAGNIMTRQLQLPDNVYEFSSHQPETKILEDLGVAIHGQSFVNKAVTDDLSIAYPNALSGYFNIGLLHTSLNGRPGHAPYAPCSLSGLLSHAYDYWALGHVHGREILHENPWVVFPGNLQGRHVRETGAKGCSLVHIDNGKTRVTHISVDVLRWEKCLIDACHMIKAEEVVEKVQGIVSELCKNAEERPLAVRFVIEGKSAAHNELHSNPERWTNEIRAAATDMSSGHLWVEKVSFKTESLSTQQRQEEGAIGELEDFLDHVTQNNDALQALHAEFAILINALPLEARQDNDPNDPETTLRLLKGVKELLMARLLAH